MVIAAGGGGIPVVKQRGGLLRGVPAVVDKDAASSLLASNLDAHTLLISTGVDRVALNYGLPNECWLDRMTLKQARLYLRLGHFAAGSMGPKIEAAIRFLENGGRRVIITQPHQIERAMAGRAGTRIIP